MSTTSPKYATTSAPATTNDLDPAAASYDNPATDPAVTPNEFDAGAPVDLGLTFAYADGTRTSHNGFDPVRLAPSDSTHRQLIQRKYHAIKAARATAVARDVWFARLQNRPAEWDARAFGPAPETVSLRGGALRHDFDYTAALARLDAVIAHHQAAFNALDAELRARHIEPDSCNVS